MTGCDPDYVGSITLDPELMRQADQELQDQFDVAGMLAWTFFIIIAMVLIGGAAMLDRAEVVQRDRDLAGSRLH